MQDANPWGMPRRASAHFQHPWTPGMGLPRTLVVDHPMRTARPRGSGSQFSVASVSGHSRLCHGPRTAGQKDGGWTTPLVALSGREVDRERWQKEHHDENADLFAVAPLLVELLFGLVHSFLPLGRPLMPIVLRPSLDLVGSWHGYKERSMRGMGACVGMGDGGRGYTAAGGSRPRTL